MRHRLRPVPLVISLSAAAAIALSVPAAFGCGYDDDVSVARGLLNWVYPDLLQVIGAMSAAVAERRLPAPTFDAGKPEPFGSGYRKTAQSLEKLGMELGASSTVPPLSFSLVLVEPVLWTRFEAAGGALRARVHVAGPAPGDLVLVTGEAVLGEIASGRLSIGEARSLGFIRFYGTEAQVAAFLDAYRSIGGEPRGHHAASQSLLEGASQ